VRIPQPLLDVGLDDLARRKAARGQERSLARPLEVTRPCLAVRQDGIDVNGRNIAFGGCIEVEPPHPVVLAKLGVGRASRSSRALDLLSSDGARPREQGLVPSAASGASTGGHGHSGVRSAQPRCRPISGHREVCRLRWLADRLLDSRHFGNGTSDSANVLETLCRTVLL